MTPLAHAGHWTTGIIEVAPFIIMVVWLLTTTWRDRRRTASEERSEGEVAPGDSDRDDDRAPPRGSGH